MVWCQAVAESEAGDRTGRDEMGMKRPAHSLSSASAISSLPPCERSSADQLSSARATPREHTWEASRWEERACRNCVIESSRCFAILRSVSTALSSASVSALF